MAIDPSHAAGHVANPSSRRSGPQQRRREILPLSDATANPVSSSNSGDLRPRGEF
ncbi:hypothetical protein JCGZ_22192 [Jatropha curcas]|uniref:Uncharacterized protein n=1 Tax=Jatropha curcas TaxID=180498 RepID=A0A067JSV5_JATCU|nr:hypothetical protein JCGZ_22192 [Jatropha curcas]